MPTTSLLEHFLMFDWPANTKCVFFSYLLVREARECTNKHLFCHTCVFAWSLTYGENSQKCPMCRADQRTYRPNKEVSSLYHVY